MGRIKSTLVKRASKQLIQSEHNFIDKFDHNKKILGRTMPSKKIRNKIAGYLAHIIRMKNEQAKREERMAIKRAAAAIVPAQRVQEF